MKSHYILCLFFSLLFSCQSQETPPPTIEQEISSLTDISMQKAFLEKIATSDQAVRKEETAINQKYGHDSKEHKQAWKIINETDKNNLEKIEAYLNKYGHPNKIDHGNEGFYAPWLVLQHADPQYGARRRNFKYLYESYKKDMLETSRLTFFLGRLHNIELGHRIRWDKPFTVQEELDSMLNALDLREITDKIDKEFMVRQP